MSNMRFLLPSDATMLIANATASNVVGAPFVPTSEDVDRADSLCSQ